MARALARSALFVNVDVTEAFEMRQHRHAGFFLHARDKAFAAARNDEVDGAVEAFEHFADGGAIRCGDELDGSLG